MKRALSLVAAFVVALPACKAGIESSAQAGNTAVKPQEPEPKQAPPVAAPPAKDESSEISLRLYLGTKAAGYATEESDHFSDVAGFPKTLALRCTTSLVADGVPAKDLGVYLAAAGDLASLFTDRNTGLGRATAALGHAKRHGQLLARDLVSLGIGLDALREIPAFAKKSDAQITAFLTGDGEAVSTDQFIDLIAHEGSDKTKLGDLAMGSKGTPRP